MHVTAVIIPISTDSKDDKHVSNDFKHNDSASNNSGHKHSK